MGDEYFETQRVVYQDFFIPSESNPLDRHPTLISILADGCLLWFSRLRERRTLRNSSRLILHFEWKPQSRVPRRARERMLNQNEKRRAMVLRLFLDQARTRGIRRPTLLRLVEDQAWTRAKTLVIENGDEKQPIPEEEMDDGVQDFRCRVGKRNIEDFMLNNLWAGRGAVASGHEERSACANDEEICPTQWGVKPVHALCEDHFHLELTECIHNRAKKRLRRKQPIPEEGELDDEDEEKENTAADFTRMTRSLEEEMEASDGEDSSSYLENSAVESAAQSPLSQKDGAPCRLGDPNAGCSKRKWKAEEEDMGLVSILKAQIEESLQTGLHALISVLKSKEESEQRYRQKLLSLEEQKLILKQQKLQNHRRDRVRAHYNRLHVR